MFDAEGDAIWALIHARANGLAEIRQRAEVLATECKSGPAADGRLVALALALVAIWTHWADSPARTTSRTAHHPFCVTTSKQAWRDHPGLPFFEARCDQ